MKEASVNQLVEAIRQVLGARPYVSPPLSAHYLAGVVGATTAKLPLDRLTDRELEVFDLIGRGRSQEEIAKQLNIRPRTAEAHQSNIRKKLGLSDCKELFCYAVRHYASGA